MSSSQTLKKFLPWVTLCIGIFSGLLMSRESSRGLRVLFFFIGVLIFSGLTHIWLKKREKNKFSKYVEWAGTTSVQSCFQYILLFCLPFLFWSHSWWLFFPTLLLSATTLWDPWWHSLSVRVWYQCLVRIWATMLSVSFLVSLFWDEWLILYPVVFWGVTLISSHPWTRKLPEKGFRREFFPFIFTAIVCALFSVCSIRPPLIAFWLKEERFVWRNGDKTFQEETPFHILKDTLAEKTENGMRLCCVTPVVSGNAGNFSVDHVWFMDGKQIDRIALPPIRGSEKGYKTYSCKSKFGAENLGTKLRCEVFLQENFFIGSTQLEIIQP